MNMTPTDPKVWIESLPKPPWKDWFMGMAVYYAMRSPDRQTKQGCVIVDWTTKIPIGLGYNGHPSGCGDLPVDRPEKYPYMTHAEMNAALTCRGPSDHAVVFCTMTPCAEKGCIHALINLRLTGVNVREIVYWEEREGLETTRIVESLADPIVMTHYTPSPQPLGDPTEILEAAATYISLRPCDGIPLTPDQVEHT